MSKDDESRLMAVELAKRLLVDAIWKTASIEVDGISFRDTQEIFEGRAPANMVVDDIIVVNNIKRAWMFLFENVDQPVNWQYMSEYNRILGEGLIRDAGKLRTNEDRITRGPCSAHVLQDHARTMVQRREQANRAHDGEPCAHQRRHRRILHKPVPETRIHNQAIALLRVKR